MGREETGNHVGAVPGKQDTEADAKAPVSSGRPSHKQRVPERIIFKAQNKQKGGREEHTHLHTHRHTHTHVHTRTHRYTYIYTQTHTHRHTYTQMHTHVHTETWKHTDIYTNTHIHRYTRIHTDTYTYLHTDTHTYTHVHTRVLVVEKRLLTLRAATLNAGSSLPIMDVIPSGM